MWGAIKKAINSNLNKSLDVLIQEKTIEINNKIENNASQKSIVNLDTKVQTGNNLIGVTTDAVGTNTLGSVFAKLNKLLTDWTTTRAGYIDTTVSSRQVSWGATIIHRDRIDTTISSRASQASVDTLLNGRVIKSVQRGVFKMNGSSTIYGIPITSINTLKSIVILDGLVYATSTATRIPYVHNLTSNILEIGMNTESRGADYDNISWQVIEFY